MKRYKANYEDEIGCLKHQVKSLEEEKDSIRRQLQELIKANQDGAERGGHTDIEEKRWKQLIFVVKMYKMVQNHKKIMDHLEHIL